MKLIICNLKNRLEKNENISYSKFLDNLELGDYKLVVAPSMPFMNYYNSYKYSLASQDISSFDGEIITGEVTGDQLSSVGCKYVIIGHSERRINNKEININFINKINNAHSNDMEVIFCIGETLSDRINNNHYNVLEQQISEVLNNVEIKNIIIAYEPVFSIGGEEYLSNEEIEDTIQYIKDITFEKYEVNFKVLYGGGISNEVLKRVNTISIIDGYLIGNNSTDIEEIKAIINTLNSYK